MFVAIIIGKKLNDSPRNSIRYTLFEYCSKTTLAYGMAIKEKVGKTSARCADCEWELSTPSPTSICGRKD